MPKKTSRKYLNTISLVLLLLCLLTSGCTSEIGDETTKNTSSQKNTSTEKVTSDKKIETQAEYASQEVTTTQNKAEPYVAVENKLEAIPEYTGEDYVAINNNIPYFTDADSTTEPFEYYSELDTLGRCGVAYANICVDLMPTEERGKIGSIKPSGWHSVKYDNVDGKYLYNRCHLIGYQLAGENANDKNLITGTRHMNVEGMLPFENMVADYVTETKNHVLYRVTPVFDGNNLVASGVIIEAKSVEDNGKSILFNVFCFNIQPGISINYATGDSELIQETTTTPTTTQPPTTQPPTTQPPVYVEPEQPQENSYMCNLNTNKFHRMTCRDINKMSEKNKMVYTGSRDDLINQGYSPCKNCNP